MAVEISGDTGVSRAQPTALPFLVGQVCFFAQNAVPDGFLKANGAAVSRTTYAALFAAIGTTYGAGNGSTTFNLPDFRGEFPRGFDDGRGVDSGRAFGSAQAELIKQHKHDVGYSGHSLGANFGGNPQTPGATFIFSPSGVNTTSLYGSRFHADNFGFGFNDNQGAETRPRNIAVLACIKY